jgi:hypothetical protein
LPLPWLLLLEVLGWGWDTLEGASAPLPLLLLLLLVWPLLRECQSPARWVVVDAGCCFLSLCCCC